MCRDTVVGITGLDRTSEMDDTVWLQDMVVEESNRKKVQVALVWEIKSQ